MYKNKKIGVVVPAYNEEELIEETVSGIPGFIDRIYIINDGSTDNTKNIIDKLSLNDGEKRIKTFHHEKNKGVGAAVIHGYKEAINDSLDVVTVMDGDNQMDPEFLPSILDPIVSGEADYSTGNRLIYPEYRVGMSKWRFFGNAVLTFLTKIASGYWQLMDPQNGYKAISVRALKVINPDKIYTGYGYMNDILVRLNVYGFRVKSIPHPARYGRENSSIKYRKYIVKVSSLLLRDFMWRLKMKYVVLSFHPLVFFYFFGIIFSTIGFIAGIFALWEKIFGGIDQLFVHGTLALLIFMMGMIFLLFAMLYDMEQEKNTNGWY